MTEQQFETILKEVKLDDPDYVSIDRLKELYRRGYTDGAQWQRELREVEDSWRTSFD